MFCASAAAASDIGGAGLGPLRQQAGVSTAPQSPHPGSVSPSRSPCEGAPQTIESLCCAAPIVHLSRARSRTPPVQSISMHRAPTPRPQPPTNGTPSPALVTRESAPAHRPTVSQSFTPCLNSSVCRNTYLPLNSSDCAATLSLLATPLQRYLGDYAPSLDPRIVAPAPWTVISMHARSTHSYA